MSETFESAEAAYAPWESDEPTVSESSGIRYLHFGTEWVQGAMRLRRPNDLVLAYTQQMMAWLLLVEPEAEDHIGILGLGAGSLLRYTLRNTPSQVATAEWNPMVSAVCRSHFRLPESPRSEIDHCDAADWVREPRNIGRFTALMVDLYDAYAQGPVRGSPGFYQDCAHALADPGVITVNLFGDHGSFEPNLEGLRTAFPDGMLVLPEIDAGNRIAIGVKGDLLNVSVGRFIERAEMIERQYRLPAVRWARDMLQQLHFSHTLTRSHG
ncbi:MAG: spermidine synthase [Alcaligenaceae bacterium]|nr:spermidine synthase [Alcaligenaceae bacterium]